jgi:hypothetical protein
MSSKFVTLLQCVFVLSSHSSTFLGQGRELFLLWLLKSNPATRHGGALGERRYSSYSFSTSALDEGEWSASRPGRPFTPGERTPGTHCTGGWVGPRAGLNTEDRGKILCPRRGSNPDRPVVQPVVRHYTDWATPAPVGLLASDQCSLSFGRKKSIVILYLHTKISV